MTTNPLALERPVRTPQPIGVWVENPYFHVGGEDDSCIYITVDRDKANTYAKKHKCSIMRAAEKIAQAEVWG